MFLATSLCYIEIIYFIAMSKFLSNDDYWFYILREILQICNLIFYCLVNLNKISFCLESIVQLELLFILKLLRVSFWRGLVERYYLRVLTNICSW